MYPENNRKCKIHLKNGNETIGISMYSYSWTGNDDETKICNCFRDLKSFYGLTILWCSVESWEYLN